MVRLIPLAIGGSLTGSTGLSDSKPYPCAGQGQDIERQDNSSKHVLFVTLAVHSGLRSPFQILTGTEHEC